MTLVVLFLMMGLTLAIFITSQKRPHDLHWTGDLMLLPWLWFGYLLDVALNVSVASIVFLEPPFELTLSSRVRRHEHWGGGYRKRLAGWICKAYLRPVDDEHC